MKKKIINDNTMEVLMNKQDLKRYKITVLDLLGDHEHVQHFFYHLLEKIDNNHQFSTNRHLIFKILPSKDGLELIISKRSSRPNLRFHSRKSNIMDANKRNHAFSCNNVVKLKTFEDVIKVAHLLSLNKGSSNLYVFHGAYYLELWPYLKTDQLNVNIIKNELSIAYEYGSQAHLNHSFLLKNGKEIINNNALEVIRHYFK